jgi:hypothetical protein
LRQISFFWRNQRQKGGMLRPFNFFLRQLH